MRLSFKFSLVMYDDNITHSYIFKFSILQERVHFWIVSMTIPAELQHTVANIEPFIKI